MSFPVNIAKLLRIPTNKIFERLLLKLTNSPFFQTETRGKGHSKSTNRGVKREKRISFL